MKKKYWLMGVAGVMVLTSIVGGTWASLNTNTENGVGAGVAEVTTKAIQVAFAGEKTEKSVLTDADVTPGAFCKYEQSIKNDTTDGYDIYVKVNVYKYWADETTEEQNAVLEEDGSYYAYDADLNGAYAALCFGDAQEDYDSVEVGDVTENGWLVAYEDEEQITLYYTKPLAAGEQSENFLDGISFSTKMNNAYTGKTLALEFEVNAVQANNSADAIAAEWGVFPTFDADGTIISVSETR